MAGVAAKKLITATWKLVMASDPPANPEDPATSWGEAIGWAVASGAVVGVARLFATRKAAEYYLKSTGDVPANANSVS
jgi:hypothetical protein